MICGSKLLGTNPCTDVRVLYTLNVSCCRIMGAQNLVAHNAESKLMESVK